LHRPWSQRPRLIRKKWGIALSRLAQEDPFVKTDEASGQTIIAGMGERCTWKYC
jgi:hypothetical protein